MPPGKKSGHRWLSSPFSKRVSNCEVPPASDTCWRAERFAGAKAIIPWLPPGPARIPNIAEGQRCPAAHRHLLQLSPCEKPQPLAIGLKYQSLPSRAASGFSERGLICGQTEYPKPSLSELLHRLARSRESAGPKAAKVADSFRIRRDPTRITRKRRWSRNFPQPDLGPVGRVAAVLLMIVLIFLLVRRIPTSMRAPGSMPLGQAH